MYSSLACSFRGPLTLRALTPLGAVTTRRSRPPAASFLRLSGHRLRGHDTNPPLRRGLSTGSEFERVRVQAILEQYSSRLNEHQLSEALAKIAAGGGALTRRYGTEAGGKELAFKLKQSVKMDEDGLVSRADVASWWASAGLTDDADPSKQEAPPIMTRAAAGLIDGACVGLVSIPLGIAAGGLAKNGDIDVVVGIAAALGGSVGILGYAFRDCIFNGGTRSIGKSIMGLEIVKMNNGFPTDNVAKPQDCLMRNSYGILPFFPSVNNKLGALGMVDPFPLQPLNFLCEASDFAAGAIGITDTLLILFSTQRRSVGDRLANTMVVVEGPNHEARKARALSEL